MVARLFLRYRSPILTEDELMLVAGAFDASFSRQQEALRHLTKWRGTIYTQMAGVNMHWRGSILSPAESLNGNAARAMVMYAKSLSIQDPLGSCAVASADVMQTLALSAQVLDSERPWEFSIQADLCRNLQAKESDSGQSAYWRIRQISDIERVVRIFGEVLPKIVTPVVESLAEFLGGAR